MVITINGAVGNLPSCPLLGLTTIFSFALGAVLLGGMLFLQTVDEIVGDLNSDLCNAVGRRKDVVFPSGLSSIKD